MLYEETIMAKTYNKKPKEHNISNTAYVPISYAATKEKLQFMVDQIRKHNGKCKFVSSGDLFEVCIPLEESKRIQKINTTREVSLSEYNGMELKRILK